MKIVNRMFLSVMCMIALGCSKDYSGVELDDKLNYNDRRLIPRPRFPAPLPICVNNYDLLVRLLGGSEVKVIALVLQDGTTINAGQAIVSMHYKAVEKKEDYSLFRSQFTVRYNLYGYQQSGHMDAWSLGCVYENAGEPPYTNIKKQGRIIRINTSFSWGIPPHIGKRIAYLVIE